MTSGNMTDKRIDKDSRVLFEFGAGEAQGKDESRQVLGGKGAGLAEMTALGVPVPPGFTISTAVCDYYSAQGVRQLPTDIKAEIASALERMGDLVGAKFGDAENPLLVSVRSGAPVSMPGMMDTVLNLGLNDKTVVGLAQRSGDRRFAYDCYRRFIAMYGEVVLGISSDKDTGTSPFARILEQQKVACGALADAALTAGDLQSIIERYVAEISRRGMVFPQDPLAQLWGAVEAVFCSWNNSRAVTYRQLRGIADSPGTAVNVQAMVFGNMGQTSATGVAFTRNPSTGEPGLFGEFLVNAQGEDVVAGVRTPRPIDELKQVLPDSYQDLIALAERLEGYFCDMQDIEFTVENGTLWLLQTRTGKRSGRAMVRIATDLVKEGRVDPKEAIRRIEPGKLEEVLHPTIDPNTQLPVLARGLPASPRRSNWPRCFYCRRSGNVCRPWTDGYSRANRDFTRGYSWDEDCARHTYRARWDDISRCGGRAWTWNSLCDGVFGDSHRCCGRHFDCR